MSPMFHAKTEIDRLSIRSFINTHPDATFFMEYQGPIFEDFSIIPKDILVIDKSILPKSNSLCVYSDDSSFYLSRFNTDEGFWGVVSYVIHKTI